MKPKSPIPLKTQRAFVDLFLMKGSTLASAAKGTGITIAQANAICRNPPRPESYKERIRREMLATPKETRQAFLDRMKAGEKLGPSAQAVGITLDVALGTLRAAQKVIRIMDWTVK